MSVTLRTNLIACTTMLFLANSTLGKDVVTYPLPPTAQTSSVFSVSVNGASVPVEKVLGVHLAQFAFEGEIEISVEAPEPVIDYRISPVSARISSWVDSNTIQFKLKEPRKLVLYINCLERLVIWADPLEDRPDIDHPEIVSIERYLENVESNSLLTDPIQKAIDELPVGGTLVFPPGRYPTGPIRLKSDRTVGSPGTELEFAL